MADHISIPGLNGISGEPPRQGQGQRQRSKPGAALERKPGTPPPPEALADPPADDPTTALVQALDRLRATHELRPAETELVRAMRGMRYYQEESRHDLPSLDDPEASDGSLPPDQIG